METKEENILPGRLQAAMDMREMTPAELARASGVHPATISLILSGDRPNTPALIVAKLARALFVSADYLMGITDDPMPRALAVGTLLIELTRVAQRLTDRRLRDLLLMARAYLEVSEELRSDPDLLMDNMLDLIAEAGGTVSRDQLIDLLNTDIDSDDDDDSPPGLGPLPDDLQ